MSAFIYIKSPIIYIKSPSHYYGNRKGGKKKVEKHKQKGISALKILFKAGQRKT